jgi:hypothetical protein
LLFLVLFALTLALLSCTGLVSTMNVFKVVS